MILEWKDDTNDSDHFNQKTMVNNMLQKMSSGVALQMQHCVKEILEQCQESCQPIGQTYIGTFKAVSIVLTPLKDL